MNEIEEKLKTLAGKVVKIVYKGEKFKIQVYGTLEYCGNNTWGVGIVECFFQQDIVEKFSEGIRTPTITLKAE